VPGEISRTLSALCTYSQDITGLIRLRPCVRAHASDQISIRLRPDLILSASHEFHPRPGVHSLIRLKLADNKCHYRHHLISHLLEVSCLSLSNSQSSPSPHFRHSSLSLHTPVTHPFAQSHHDCSILGLPARPTNPVLAHKRRRSTCSRCRHACPCRQLRFGTCNAQAASAPDPFTSSRTCPRGPPPATCEREVCGARRCRGTNWTRLQPRRRALRRRSDVIS